MQQGWLTESNCTNMQLNYTSQVIKEPHTAQWKINLLWICTMYIWQYEMWHWLQSFCLQIAEVKHSIQCRHRCSFCGTVRVKAQVRVTFLSNSDLSIRSDHWDGRNSHYSRHPFRLLLIKGIKTGIFAALTHSSATHPHLLGGVIITGGLDIYPFFFLEMFLLYVDLQAPLFVNSADEGPWSTGILILICQLYGGRK